MSEIHELITRFHKLKCQDAATDMNSCRGQHYDGAGASNVTGLNPHCARIHIT